MHPALDRADGHATDLRRLLIGQALRRNQDQGFPLIDRELSQSRAHVLEVALGILFRDCPTVGRVGPLWIAHLPLCFAMLAVEGVAQDREQPCIEVGARLKPVDVSPCPKDSVLHEIVGPIYIVGQRNRKRPQAGDRGQHGLAHFGRGGHWSGPRPVRSRRAIRSRMRSGTGWRKSSPYMPQRSCPIRSRTVWSSVGSKRRGSVPQRG